MRCFGLFVGRGNERLVNLMEKTLFLLGFARGLKGFLYRFCLALFGNSGQMSALGRRRTLNTRLPRSHGLRSGTDGTELALRTVLRSFSFIF